MLVKLDTQPRKYDCLILKWLQADITGSLLNITLDAVMKNRNHQVACRFISQHTKRSVFITYSAFEGKHLVGILDHKTAGNAGEQSHKTSFPRGLPSVTSPHKPTGSYFLLLFLKKQQWEKLNNGFWFLPMCSITAG